MVAIIQEGLSLIFVEVIALTQQVSDNKQSSFLLLKLKFETFSQYNRIETKVM
ncbi:hypothetical protein J2Z82_003770 [Virgibacillus litoralis]|uniref:Uncharacterized protein n=1 Tax=Virgibacillus litoralis TaxID=578221 RepID=A0ABS4HIV8_9BACI|nr:hypothetical protein [Virgibacillus litoralis]